MVDMHIGGRNWTRPYPFGACSRCFLYDNVVVLENSWFCVPDI